MGRSWWGVQWVLRPPSTGGPKTWNPSPARLSMMDREEIRAGLSRGNTLAPIAGEIGRSVSTISREVANNGGRDAYRAVASHERADRCARRPKASKQCFGPGRNRLQFGPFSDLFVKNGFDGLRVPSGHLIAQENLQHVLGFALDVDRFVVAGEGAAWHQAGSGTIEERSS